MIPLRSRIERALALLRSRKKPEDAMPEGGYPVEKWDVFAMIVAALIVIIPTALVVLLVLSFLSGFWAFL